MKKEITRNGRRFIALALTFAIVLTMTSLASGIAFAAPHYLANNGVFNPDFMSREETLEAARQLNIELSREGTVLLKNDGILPMIGRKNVSIFGVRQDSLTGGQGSVSQSLTDAGFKVNPTLNAIYAANNSGIGSEIVNFNKTVKNSFDLYGDAAVILISRTGGEGADLVTVMQEEADPGEHKNAVTGKKHYLELTKSEEQLIDYVKANFSKIIVVTNTSNAIEIGQLQDDPAINAIIHIGRPGNTGIAALGEILSGAVNPSGSLVDEWPRDFTQDPTWFNFGNNSQNEGGENLYYYADGTPAGNSTGGGVAGSVGYHGIDYEEDIYLGYKYYETRYAEMYKSDADAADAWWADQVVYPFGYGLSYTTFSFGIQGVYTDEALTNSLGDTVDPAQFATSIPGVKAEVDKLFIPVKVENTGSFAGKKTVQVYVTAPYTGKVEKAAVTLVGFAKTDILLPGQSQIVVVSLNVQDMASYMAENNTGYILEAGEYILRAMDSSHVDLCIDVADTADAYDQAVFNLSGDANLKLDDYSLNAITNLFSEENGDYYTIRTADLMAGDSGMTLMKRSDFEGTFPVAPGLEDRTINDELVRYILNYELFNIDNPEYENYPERPDYLTYDENEAWAGDVNVPATWTQAAETAQKNDILFADMAGIDPNGQEPIVSANEKLNGLTGEKAWETFMNQLSWAEIRTVVSDGSYRTAALPSVNKIAGRDQDGPNSFGGYAWCDEPVIASTFNTALAHEQGIIVGNTGLFNGSSGWYGPGMNTHRSPFSGRNNEYYSQDGVHGGYIAAAVVSGAESRGLLVYAKHMFINDQETNRNVHNLFTWASEQAMREIYAKPFQMAMQEGGGSAAMTAFGRLGKVAAATNYNFTTALTRTEWGWKGFYVTDMYAGANQVGSIDLMVRTGNDLPLGTNPGNANVMIKYIRGDNPATENVEAEYQITQSSHRSLSGDWDASLRDGMGGVVVGADKAQNDAQWYFARATAQRVLFGAANSANNRNKLDLSGYAGTTLSASQYIAANGLSFSNSDVKVNDDTIITYAITSGELPAGLSFNSATGAISGTPTKAGSYDVSVTLSGDYYVSSNAAFTLDIAPAFESEVTEGKVGEELGGYISTEILDLSSFGDTLRYAVTDGRLPNGVTIDEADGFLYGTPTEAGVFNYTVTVTGVVETQGSRGTTRTTTTYTYDGVLTIAE